MIQDDFLAGAEETIRTQPSGPVECLGMTFDNDEQRREYFTAILREKLKDPEFRQIEGFPIGEDEDILNLSDPPYYTACPNPFIEQFVELYGTPYDPDEEYSREPYAADVSEGKNDPIYNAHSYHTKVPHKAIMRYILHYTKPGDLVFDGFCGTGMTGVAAQMCGDKATVESLGYKVLPDGTILDAEVDDEGKSKWKAVSHLGERYALLNDLSPAASFISSNYNSRVDSYTFEKESANLLGLLTSELGWMYKTLHRPTEDQLDKAVASFKKSKNPDILKNYKTGTINYIVWSDVFVCPNCVNEVIFWDAATNRDLGKILDKFECPTCKKELTKRDLERSWITGFDSSINQELKIFKQKPVWINYSVENKRFEKPIDEFDQILIEHIENLDTIDWYPKDKIIKGDKTGEPERVGVNYAHQFYRKSSLAWLASWRSKLDKIDYRYLAPFSTINSACQKTQ